MLRRGGKRYLMALLILILIIVYFAIFGERGLTHLARLNKEFHRIENFNKKLGKENRRLKREISILKNEEGPRFPEMIKRRAREELGWAEENDVIYQFRK